MLLLFFVYLPLNALIFLSTNVSNTFLHVIVILKLVFRNHKGKNVDYGKRP